LERTALQLIMLDSRAEVLGYLSGAPGRTSKKKFPTWVKHYLSKTNEINIVKL